MKSIEETKEYLERLFGFKCWFRGETRNTLVVESEYVHFFVMEHDGEFDFMGKQHISFQVGSLSQIEDELRRLGVKDFETGEVSFFETRNYKWCEWRDSNRIRFECIEIINGGC